MSERSGKTEIVKVQADSNTLELFYAYPQEGQDQPLPTILVLHAWAGRDSFMCEKASYFARQGFLSIAVDLFGEARIGKTTEECQSLIHPFITNRLVLKQRLSTLMDFIKNDPRIDKNRIAAIGYCFGGLCALDMARNNLGLKAAISVHGLLFKPDYALPNHYSAQVLALHGHQDPMVPIEQVAEFQKEMANSVADWQFLTFGQGVHAFTMPTANDSSLGTVYNPLLDQRATTFIDCFLQESFK